MSRSFYEFIELIADERPLSGSYFGDCVSMRWDAWRVVRLIAVELGKLSLMPDLRLLDLGCGIGIYSSEILKRWPFIDVSGVDLSIKNIQLARNYVPQAHFLQCDAEKTPFEDDSFDIIIAVEVFEHFLDPDAVVNELKRIIRPGGKLVIVVPLAPPIPFVDRISALATRFIGSKVISDGDFKEHMRIYDFGSLVEQFGSGWKINRYLRFNIITFVIAGVEKISRRLAGYLARRCMSMLDHVDLVLGKIIYAKTLVIFERLNDNENTIS